MDDEQRKPIDRVVHTVVFSLVAIIVITSVALPIFASIGTTTVTTSLNDGMLMSSVNEKYSDLIQSFDDNEAEIICNSTGVHLIGEVSGVQKDELILPIDKHIKDQPLLLIMSTTVPSVWILEYTGDELPYMLTTPPGSPSPRYQFGLYLVYGEDLVFVQDPAGELHLEEDEGYYTDLTDVFGYSYGPEEYLLVRGTAAMLRTDITDFGTASIDYDVENGIYHVTDTEYKGYSCEYYLCPDIEITEERDLLDGWGPVKSMIGVIPVLIMIGAILTVAHRMRMSDR